MCAAITLVLGATAAVGSLGGSGSTQQPSDGEADRAATSRDSLASTPNRVSTPRSSPPPSPPRSEPPTADPAPEPAPEPVRIPVAGGGEFEVVDIEESAMSDDQVTYTVEIEAELPFPGRATARTIGGILDDDRGWGGVSGTSFRQVVDDPEIRILVASPDTTDELCAPLQTRGQVSCRNGGLVVLNARRWAFGIPDYQGDLVGYRGYLVNHEVGHALGGSHVECPGAGRPAPVMQQQTYGLDGCTQNPWPTVG